MRIGRLAPLVACLALPLLTAAKPQTPANPPKSPEKPTHAAHTAAASSFWEPLVTPGARFVLLGAPPPSSPASLTTSVTPGPRIVVESYDARVVHGAKVARLRWVVEDNGARSPMGNSLPTQIAVTRKGAWLLTERLDDKGVAAALARKPSFADPPRLVENDDGYVRRDASGDGNGLCIGIGTPPAKPCPAGICHAEYCLAPGIGLTSMSGNYTPSAGAFVSPKPSEAFGLELRTGVPECDSFLGEWARCVQEVMAPDMREQLNDALRQMAETYRQQAATPDGAKQAAAVCLEVAPQMTDALRGMGCHI
jgi:hypothetical protein